MNLGFGWPRLATIALHTYSDSEYRDWGVILNTFGLLMDVNTKFSMFWLLTEYSTENSCVWWVSWKTTSFCASLGSFCLCNTQSAIFSFILYPFKTIRGFVFIVLSSPKFMFRDFAKVESRNLGWKSGLCNNFTFVTLSQTRAELKATPQLVQRGGRS